MEREVLEAISGAGSEPAVEVGVGLASGAEGADVYASGRARVRSEDHGDCGSSVDRLVGEVVVDGEVEGGERQRWRHRQERTVVYTADLVGRREMMMSNISSGRRLMRSTLAGGSCESGSTCLCLLAISASISASGDTSNAAVSSEKGERRR